MSDKDFRLRPISDRIIYALIEATQSYSYVAALLSENPTIKPVLCDMLLSLDIYYDIYDAQPDIADICIGLYISSQENAAGRNIEVIRSCAEYAQSKVQTTDVLTAGDILKINSSIKNVDIKQLTIDQDSYRVDAVWSVLHNLYEPQRQYPLLLEVAIASYSLLTLSYTYQFTPQSLVILLSTLYKNRLAFLGLPRQWILSTDPRLGITLMDIEDALVHILGVFKEMWLYTIKVIRKLSDEKERLSQLVKLNCPRQMSMGFCNILSQNICIRNRAVSGELCISPKTTIKYLKQLEQEKILISIKHGREIFYFNNVLLGFLGQTIEVLHNGAEKS